MKVDAPRHPQITSIALIVPALLVAALATADEAEDRKAEAQRLFAEGQVALDKGDNATACPLMRKSLALFAVANSLFNVAQCDERDGKLTSAVEFWKRGLALIDEKDKRSPVVKKAIDDLEGRVPRMRIVVAPKHVPLEVELDGEAVPKDKLEVALPVDPGKRVIIVRKVGHNDRRVEIVLSERERTEVIAEPGELLVAPLPSASAVPSVSASVMPPPGMPPMKLGGFVALGVGGAAILGAIISGGVIESNHGKIEDACGGIACANEGTKDLIKSQEQLLPLNATFWGIGIAGAAAGTIMLVVSSQKPKDRKAAIVMPLVSRDGMGIGLSGRF